MTASNDEFSLREMFIKIGSVTRYLISKWKTFLAVSFVFAIIAITIVWLSKPDYEAKTSFVLSTAKESSGLMGLASQFGFDLGGSNNDAFSGDNIITLFKTELMLRRALFKPVPGSGELLINRYVKGRELDRVWAKKDRTKNAFPFPANQQALTPLQDSLIREVHEKLIEESLVVEKIDKKTSIYEVKTTTGDEVFSCFLTRFLVDETTKYYVETKTKIARQNLTMLQNEADSLRSLLGGTITQTAQSLDNVFNLNPAFQRNRAPVQQGQARATVLGAAYGEVVKHLEVAKITLQKETPLLQLLDQPRLPLEKKKMGRLKGGVIGGIIGFIATLFYLIGIRMYRNVMRNDGNMNLAKQRHGTPEFA